MKYLVSHNDKRGVWGKDSENSITPLPNLAEAYATIRCMTGKPVIYRLELVAHPKKPKILTATQNKYFDYILNFKKKKKRQPTLLEIAKHFCKGISTIYMTLQKAGINYACYREIKNNGKSF